MASTAGGGVVERSARAPKNKAVVKPAIKPRSVREAYRESPDKGFMVMAALPPDQVLLLVKIGLAEERRCLEEVRHDKETMKREVARFLHESRVRMLVQAALRSVVGGAWRRAGFLMGVGLKGHDLDAVAWAAGVHARYLLKGALVPSLLGLAAVFGMKSWLPGAEMALGCLLALLPLGGFLAIFRKPFLDFSARWKKGGKALSEGHEMVWVAFAMGFRDREAGLIQSVKKLRSGRGI